VQFNFALCRFDGVRYLGAAVEIKYWPNVATFLVDIYYRLKQIFALFKASCILILNSCRKEYFI